MDSAAAPTRPLSSTPASCFIFDLDGTLMDFVAVFNEMTRRVWTAFNIGMTQEKLDELGEFARTQVQGKSTPWLIVKLLWNVAKRMGLPWRKRFSFLKASGREFRTLLPTIKFFPGTLEALATLRQAGYPIAIQTQASLQEIERHFVQYPDFLRQYVDLLLGRDDVKHMKPAPDGIQLAARHFGVPPSRCVFVGDMEIDMQAAKAAGAVGVGVLTGFDTRDRLTAAGATLVLVSVADLPSVLDTILALMKESR